MQVEKLKKSDMPRTYSLRNILIASLLVFSVVPTALVGWVMYRSHADTVDVLSDKIVQDVASRVLLDTEAHLGEAHTIMNGLMLQPPSQKQTQRAQQLLQTPALFEQTAFSLTGMTSNVPYMYFGTAQGDFLGVETAIRNPTNQLRVGVRTAGDEGRRYFLAASPGDRSTPQATEAKNYEPRSRPWYQAAMLARERVFTAVYPSASKKQLVITLAQPVLGDDAGYKTASGVFAVDLYLKRLSELLQTQHISAHGAAFLVDELGYLVASSAGDILYTESAGKLERNKPDQSANAVIRAAYQKVMPLLGKTKESSVEREIFEGRIGTGDDALIAVMKPFGERLGLRWSLVVVAPENDFTGDIAAAVRTALLTMLGVILSGAALAAWFAHRLSRRFERLSQAALQLGQGQIPEVQTRARIFEVRTLSSAMHSSAREIVRNHAEIAAQTAALESANLHLETRVQQRTSELEASREEALGAVRAKAAFLATMSHEIRTPLNGVVGMTTLLADTPLDVEQQDYVHTMRVSSDQLLGVINDILDFSKIESGKLDLEDEPLNLQTAIEEACDIGAPRAREKGLELLVDMGDHLPTWVRGDITRLRQVLLNFINNAVKFTEKGQVLVSSQLIEDFEPGRGALIEFRVKDTGIGIPADRIGALFQSFSQVDASTTRKYGGTGLGLAISKRLAEIMGGTVGVESAPGQGSVFWFTARLGYADTPDASQTSVLQMTSLAGKRALVVDDTPVNLRILDKQLGRWGMHNVLFERAQHALDWLAQAGNAVDVIVTDMHMPEMDGHTFSTLVRQQQPNAHIVLLTSGTMPTGEAARVFDARLLKPYRQSQLFDALARVTTDQRAAKKAAAPTVPSKNQLVLVADDNLVNLKVALAMLTKLGYEAATALNGREAADLVATSLRPGNRPYAAVLMDANMPVMDGFAACRLILQTHGHAAPPVVALTASVMEEDRKRCLDAGMLGFLPKPLRIDELSEALARYARNAKPVESLNAIDNIANYAIDTPANSTLNQDYLTPDALLMDWSRLNQFKEFDDDVRSMTREVIALFTTDVPERMQGIAQAASSLNSTELSRAAHALKGSASNVGAVALAAACGALEQACLQGNWPQNLAQLVKSIDQLQIQTLSALEQALREMPAHTGG